MVKVSARDVSEALHWDCWRDISEIRDELREKYGRRDPMEERSFLKALVAHFRDVSYVDVYKKLNLLRDRGYVEFREKAGKEGDLRRIFEYRFTEEGARKLKR